MFIAGTYLDTGSLYYRNDRTDYKCLSYRSIATAINIVVVGAFLGLAMAALLSRSYILINASLSLKITLIAGMALALVDGVYLYVKPQPPEKLNENQKKIKAKAGELGRQFKLLGEETPNTKAERLDWFSRGAALMQKASDFAHQSNVDLSISS